MGIEVCVRSRRGCGCKAYCMCEIRCEGEGTVGGRNIEPSIRMSSFIDST